LLALIVAGLSKALPYIDITRIAVYFSSFCWIGIVWVIFLFRRSLAITEWQAAIIGLVIIACGWVNWLGMEVYLFAFLLILSVALFYNGRWQLSGIITGLLFLTRGEGVLVLFSLVMYSLVEEWTKEKRFDFQTIRPTIYLIIGFSLPFLVWFVYAHFTFGNFLPNTLFAKIAQGKIFSWTKHGGGFSWSFGNKLVRDWIPGWGSQFAPSKLPFLNLWWLLVIVGVGFAVTKKRKWIVFAIWIGMYISGYTVLGVPPYDWYQLPIVFVLNIFAALGLIKSIETLSRSSRNRSLQLLGRLTAVCLVFFVIFTLGRPTVNAVLDPPHDPRIERYPEICNWISENTQSSESIAYTEIGYLGYYTDNRIVDLLGLITPGTASHIAEGDVAWAFWQDMPDYYLYLPSFSLLANIPADQKFILLYHPIATLPGPKKRDFVIYKRSSRKLKELNSQHSKLKELNSQLAALSQSGRYSEAVKVAEQALKVAETFGPNHGYVAFSVNNLVSVYISQGKYAETESLLKRMLKIAQLNPGNPALHYRLGNLYQRKGELDEAIEQYEKALSIQPGYTLALNNLAAVYTIKKEYIKAVSVFKKMIRLRPNTVGAFYNIACIYARQNKIEESIDWLKKAIERGFKNWNLIKTDKDLENIRGSSYYKEIMRGH
jgi:tetratricopeptide (TPR) repeat protein